MLGLNEWAATDLLLLLFLFKRQFISVNFQKQKPKRFVVSVDSMLEFAFGGGAKERSWREMRAIFR